MEKLIYLALSPASEIWDAQERTKIQTLMVQKYAPFLDQEEFIIEGHASSERVQIKTTFQKQNGGRSYPIECVHIKDEYSQDLEDEEIALTLLDYLDCYWSSYLTEERSVFLPIDWSLHSCENISFYLRGSVRQTQLEEESDAFLRQHGHGDYEIHPLSQDM